jgi:LysM repeat protein
MWPLSYRGRVARHLLLAISVSLAADVCASALTAGPASAGTVRVARGETLWSIASRYGTTVAALAAANDITNPNLVHAGALLQIPTPSMSGASLSSTIVVGPGDTLTAIAARYHTTAAALAAANGISNPNLVYAGSHLRLPDQSIAEASYTEPATGGSGGLPPALLAHPDRLALRSDFVQSANAYGVPASLLEALCWWESGWQESVVSSTQAVGVCQIEPSTASFVNTVLVPGGRLDVHSTAGNIAMGAAYLHDLLERAGGNESLAIASYYQGLVSVEHSGMLPTTRTYVKGILAYSAIFAAAG